MLVVQWHRLPHELLRLDKLSRRARAFLVRPDRSKVGLLDLHLLALRGVDTILKLVGELGLEEVEVTEWPLEIFTKPGRDFLEHPLLRGGFLDDVYECFDDQSLANEFMRELSQDTGRFTPLLAQRCAMSGVLPSQK